MRNLKYIIVVFLLASLPAWAETHFTLRGSSSDSYLGLNTQISRSVSASIDFDLGQYFRIGVTHRQAFNNMEGLNYNKETDSYFYSLENTKAIANSLDFTIVLYYGKILVPYVQIGVVKKDYWITSTKDKEVSDTKAVSLTPSPNGGIGLGIRLSENYSIKISYNVSQGIKQTHPDAPPEFVWDNFTSLGISYNI